VGSVFSPYYYWAGRRAPEDHCAVNVALYGPGVGRWSMTERRRDAMARDATTLSIGPSALRWDGTALTVEVDEVTVPVPRRLRGRVRLIPKALPSRSYAIDTRGRHRWMPLAPVARVEVDFAEPACRFTGHGYCDTNAGDEPIEQGFRFWTWSRADLGDGAAILYDIEERDGTRGQIAVRYDAQGRDEDFEAPPRVPLPTTLWRVRRETQAEGAATVRRTLEDTPFYARSELTTRLFGRDVPAVHESLSVTRLDSPVTRLMLPFRMPRRVF
jgi:carotenoid 1,2-hydratase